MTMPRRGENIYKRKDGRWEGRYIKSRINGKAQYGYVYARTYKEIKQKLYTVSSQYIEGVKEIKITEIVTPAVTETNNGDFETIATEWLETMRLQLKESSIVKYTNLLNTYLFPYFMDRSIGSITQEEIDVFSRRLLRCGGRKGSGLSPKTVADTRSVLKNIFVYAAQYKKYDVVDINKMWMKQPVKPMRILSVGEQQKLSQYLCANLTLANLGILVCLYTGLRIGEICALKWEDISFEEQYLHVNKTMQRIQNKNGAKQRTSILISKPKSNSSIRKIPLPDDIFALIVSTKCPEDTYFLTGHSYTFIEPRTLQNRFKAITKACGIPNANFHALRHTFATRCMELGFDAKSLSEILGHASVNITLNRYVHPSMELKKKNMNMVSDIIAVR